MKKLGSVIISVIVAMCIFAFAACDGGESEGDRHDFTFTYLLSDTSVTLNEGQTKQISVNVTPSLIEISPEFTSDNPEVAVVSESGLIRAVGEGNTTVKASVDGKTLTCSVTVKAYVLNFTGLGIIKGDTRQLTVTHGGESVASVTYSSDKTEVATVTDNGLVTAVGAGSAVITAAVDGIEILCNVTVTEEYVYSLNKTVMDLGVGLTESLSVSVTPNKEFDRPLVFTSDNPEVATVGEGNGEVTGVGIGSATITCMADGNELTCAVNVSQYTLSQTSLELRMGTSSSPLTVTVNPDRDIDVEFSSDNEEIATVNGEGVVTPVAIGNTVIKAKVGAVTLSCDVSVLAAYSYGLNKDNAKMSLGSTQQLTVTVEPDKELGEITWSSSDASVATVTDNGLVTAAGIGSAVITAKVDGETLTCEVTVIVPVEMTASEVSGKTYNLTELDDTKATLDWVFLGDGNELIRAQMLNRANLIGDLPNPSAGFSDYQAAINFYDGSSGILLNRRDGKVFRENHDMQFTVNSDVSEIKMFVGTWQSSARFSVYLGEQLLDKQEFTAGENSVNKLLTLTPDVSGLAQDQSVTLTVKMERYDFSDGNLANYSIVAIAVVGNAPRSAASATVTKTAQNEMTSGDNQIDLTQKGDADWAYLGAEGRVTDSKQDGGNIIDDSIKYCIGGGVGDDYRGKFAWSNGTVNETGAGDRHFAFGNDSMSINVKLGKGTHKVLLYVTGWNSAYDLFVTYGNALCLRETVWGQSGQSTHAYEIELTVEVTGEEDVTLTYAIAKTDKNGNLGIAAVAVTTQP